MDELHDIVLGELMDGPMTTDLQKEKERMHVSPLAAAFGREWDMEFPSNKLE